MTPPTDTAAALEAAIDKYTAAAIANAGSLGAPGEHAALSAAWCVVALEVENHVEAEVARRLAAAKGVCDVSGCCRSVTHVERDALIGLAGGGIGRATINTCEDHADIDALPIALAPRGVDAAIRKLRSAEFGAGTLAPDGGCEPLDLGDAAERELLAAIAADKARAVEAAEDAAFIRGRDAVRKYPEGWGLVARPTPDEARRLVALVAEYTEGIIDYALNGTTVVAAGHGTAVTGTIGPDPRITSIATARAALLRALGVEA